MTFGFDFCLNCLNRTDLRGLCLFDFFGLKFVRLAFKRRLPRFDCVQINCLFVQNAEIFVYVFEFAFFRRIHKHFVADEMQNDFRHSRSLALARALKNDVFHFLAAQRLSFLLAQNPRD